MKIFVWWESSTLIGTLSKLRVATIVVISILIAIFFGCIEPEDEVSEESLIEMTYFTGIDVPNTSDIFWIKLNIQKDGRSKFIKFIRHDILEAKYENLTKEEISALISFIERKNFYEMNESYVHENDFACEGDSTTIVVNIENKYKSVYAHCNLAPDSFYDIQKKLIEMGINFPDKQFGVFIKSTELDREKFEDIKATFLEKEGKEKVEKGFVSLSASELKNYPNISTSILHPEEFIFIEYSNNIEIYDFILENYDYFFIYMNNNYYQIDVFYTINESNSSSHFTEG